MPFNGSGTYSRSNGVNSGSTTWGLDKDAGTAILSSRHDTHDQDIADGLSSVICKNGETTITANLPMAGFRHTGVGNASARTHYGVTGQIQDGSYLWLGTTGGSANAQTASLSPAITAYATGQVFWGIAGATNTASATININSVGAVTIKDIYNNALIGGEILTGMPFAVLYNGTNMLLLGNAFTGCRVYNSANISINNASETALTFDSENYDTQTMHSTSSNTSRITFPRAGRVEIGAHFMFASNTTGRRFGRIILNAGTALCYDKPPTNQNEETSISLYTQYSVAASDYAEVFCYQTSGGALNVRNDSAGSPVFFARYL